MAHCRARSLLAILLLLAPAAFAHEDSESACESAGQRPDVVAARADVQRSPDLLTKRITLSDLLIGAGCYEEASHLLEAAEVSNPDNRELQYRLSRLRGMLREKRYFQGMDQAQVAAQKLQTAALQDSTQRQDTVAPRQAPHSGVAQIPAQRLADAAPHRASFSNTAQASRSN